MRRIARDVAGNTLAIMAIALIPLTAMAGAGVDTARLYVVKARLQQACDAGALAGRKFMLDSGGSALDATATKQAQQFFANNFTTGYMQSGTPKFTPTKTADNQVAGTATVTVPMTISKMVAASDVTLTVTCEARYDVADADVMFVLDTTGSMACTTSDGTAGCSQPVDSYTTNGNTAYSVREKNGSKLSGLRSAVLSFYDTLADNIDPSTNVRYGFITYSSTVNVGTAVRAVAPDAFVTSWKYNSRRLNGDNYLSKSTYYRYDLNSRGCSALDGTRSPATGYTTQGAASTFETVYQGNCQVTETKYGPLWLYDLIPLDVSQYVAGGSVLDPSKITGARSTWQGCIEERKTNDATSFDINNLPPDLDPDLMPTDDDSKWRPLWPDVFYYRPNRTSINNGGSSGSPVNGDTTNTSQYGNYTNMLMYNNIALGYVSCGKAAQRLTKMSRDDVAAYVNANDFRAQGGTYHDVGMIWGTRMLSPNGIFKGDTATWPGRNEPNRYIVFMTDGDMSPNANVYGAYGTERYDMRVSGNSPGNDLDNHNARFLAECAAAKARNITVFVVGFGQSLTQQLTQCASPGKAYYASDNASLQTAFKTIANQVAMLRVSK
ncbi:hypothetical protein BRX43_16670 [Sphingomonas sp. S-NIH.Pt15_0812]|nr:hypothetical protein BRX43_16670 [Sphingomonas sp. S-NIH.Pt15_0812]